MTRSKRVREPDHDPLSVLMERFLAAGERALTDALRGEPGLRLQMQLFVMEDGRLRTIVAPSAGDAARALGAAVRFESAELEGELTYGDREQLVNLVVSPRPRLPGAAPYYGLWEWATVYGDAAGVDRAAVNGAILVVQTARLEREVGALAAGLAALRDPIKRADAAAIEQLEAARARVSEEWRAEMQRAAMLGDASRARTAFAAGDHEEVIRLLAPHGDMLGPAARKRLQMAREALAK